MKHRRKLRVELKKLKKCADMLEKHAHFSGLPFYVALNSRRAIRRLRILRKIRRKEGRWT